MKTFAIVLSIMLAVSILLADGGGPDAYGYFWADESEAIVTYDWIDPDTTIEAVFTSTDDAAAVIDLPFPINFYDSTYSDSIIVTTNGILTFNRTIATEYYNTSIPDADAPNAAIYPLWDDQEKGTGSHLYYQTDGAAPNRIFTITWFNWFHLSYDSDPDDPLFYQVRIYETTGSDANDILFQYLDPAMSDIRYTNGGEASIGIENSTGSIGLQYSYNTASLDSGRAILFWKEPTSSHDCGVISINSPTGDIITGWPHDVEVVIRNNGSEDETTVPVFVDIISATGDTVYCESETTAIDSGAYDTLAFPDWTAIGGGTYHIYCEVLVAGDTVLFNNERSDSVIAWEHISQGGPDGLGYVWFDSYNASGPAYIAPPIADAVPIDSLYGDDRYRRFELPFTFPYYEGFFDSVWISTNGWLSFDSTMTSSHLGNDSIPDPFVPNALLAVLWDDSDVDTTADSTASIRFYHDTLSGCCWIIWNQIRLPYSSSISDVTYGVKLYTDGAIEYHYLDAHCEDDPGRDYGGEATVGIENLDGTDGLTYEYNGMPFGNPLFDHFAIRFVPPWSGPDTTAPVFVHSLPESLYAVPPEFCIGVPVQIRDYNTVEKETLYVTYPAASAIAPDSSLGEMYYFTICGLQLDDSVAYYFAASDTIGNRGVSVAYNSWLLNPHQGGPDITGYRFVDSWAEWDSMAPIVDWIELNPDSGGAGIEIAFGYSGLSEPIPFSEPVPFYGIISGGIIVSEDGWMCMDTSASVAMAAIPPSPFPNSAVPNAVVAPLWLDLEEEYSGLTGGAVYYHDYVVDSTGASFFIVQWDMFEIGTISPDLLRFQAKIYYDCFMFGSRIEFNYRNIEDFDRNVAGICIEHDTGYDGLAYLYLNDPAGAPIPINGSAVLFYQPDLNDVAEIELPEKFSIDIYPNPFNASVTIDIRGLGGAASIEIFDINGRKVGEYFSFDKSVRIVWLGDDLDGEQLPSGLYFARLSTGGDIYIRRLVLLK